ncbi:MAG: hypothetical protein HRU09_03505 [Oligoflexales bacterium]|nr:hypothetical protein [Oligoflexales bacterium]
MHQPAKTVKITNTQRIIRIFRKICQSKMQVLIRELQNPSIAVKGRALDLQTLYYGDHKKIGIIICDVSSKGLRYLFDKESVQLEFVMLSSKIACNCKIIQIRDAEVIISLPKTLVSTEKRKNTRYKSNQEAPAFLRLSIWKSSKGDALAPPYFDHHRQLVDLLPVMDISFGGVCFHSQFPAMSQNLERGVIDPHALIMLPMSPPVPVELVVRWMKTVKEHVRITSKDSISRANFYVGCSFNLHQEAMVYKIKKYIQQIIEAEAI